MKKKWTIGDKSLRDYVVQNGCYSPEENGRMYDVYYSQEPRYCFRSANKKYKLTEQLIIDVGCGCGGNLFFCHPDSYGIEINEKKVNFGKSLGLSIHSKNVGEESLEDLPKAKVVWCGGVIEHVDNLHRFMLGLNSLLFPDGLVFVHISIIPPLKILEHLPGMLGEYVSGYDSPGKHVNAFVPATLKFTCERAGFKTIEMSPFFPAPFSVFNHVSFFNQLMGKFTYVGKKADENIARNRW